MLKQTFLHLPGVQQQFELNLHKQGISDWNIFLAQETIKGIGRKRLLFYKQLLKASITALHAHDAYFFAALLPLAEHHRAFSDFKDSIGCLDIEIDKYNTITVVTITDGMNTKVLLKDVNLSAQELKRALASCSLLITFNGAAFDLPRLKKEYGFSWKGLHIDLKTIARRLGHTGGLKAIEKAVGIQRDYEQKYDVILKGGDPAQLYRMWRGSGDEYYLDLLLEYNEADALHTWLLAQKLLNDVCVENPLMSLRT